MTDGFVVPKTARLTRKRLEAIEEALNARLSGEQDTEDEDYDYAGALRWAQQKLKSEYGP